MSVAIEALYIFDDQGCLLEHNYAGRPPTAKELHDEFRRRTPPLPAVFHLPSLNPPTNVYTVSQSSLLLACTSSKDVPPQAIIDFLHRLVDIFEEFLGSPLISQKIEDNYEVVAQLLVEMCDGGIICNTEGNALREQVEVASNLGKLFAQVGLPSSAPSGGPAGLAATLKAASSTANGPAIPWRRSNVRHTSNELYVDIVETLSVIYAPSGRPISARAKGSILFTAKISGVPHLQLTLSAPGGTSSAKSAGLSRTMQLPTFHPCVLLHRWRDSPGELSFVPPDGKFMLAGYESDLMPSTLHTDQPSLRGERIFLPIIPDLRTNTGRNGTDFEARVTLNNNFPGAPAPTKPTPGRVGTGSTPFSFGSAAGSSSAAPKLEAVMISIPFPKDVRTVTELKPSRGEASFNQFTKTVEWKIPTKDGFSVSGTATLSGSVVGPFSAAQNDSAVANNAQQLSEYYDDDTLGLEDKGGDTNGDAATDRAKKQSSKSLMPQTILASFAVTGWLASGIKVSSLNVDTKKSKGLGDGVKPYKGVKYLTISKGGVERRID
ncbi:AP-3 complex subunit mu [Cyphellophora attinorum]|uniref:AP-3 complex subunit mu n=1 Tax=Cyphellophora attinorum TaxID=1664694 RepID=A0A0N1P019_9EURO|nr:AP-3 complex subunit mu [Phialophora attinorum]KPI42854.1 AP-3 complex subunit mu [Phialophora attinorum]